MSYDELIKGLQKSKGNAILNSRGEINRIERLEPASFPGGVTLHLATPTQRGEKEVSYKMESFIKYVRPFEGQSIQPVTFG